MARYIIENSQMKERIPATSNIIVKDTEKNIVFKISKKNLVQGVPIELTQELCDLLFDMDDMFYKMIPVEFRSDRMTEVMIQKYRMTYYEYFPEKYHSKEIKEKYFHNRYRHLMPNIEEGTISRDFGRYTIRYRRNGERIHAEVNIEVIDHEEDKTYRFSKNTIQKKDIFYTHELCDALCTIDDMFYKKIPKEFKSSELTNRMIQKYDYQFYEYYPEDYLTYNMTINYVRYGNSHLLFVPEKFIDQSICDLFLFAHPKCLSEIPEKFIKKEYFQYIISKGLHLGFVPLEYRSVDVCMMFIKNHPRSLGFVPDSCKEEVARRYGCRDIYNLRRDNVWMQTSEEANKILLKRKKD